MAVCAPASRKELIAAQHRRCYRCLQWCTKVDLDFFIAKPKPGASNDDNRPAHVVRFQQSECLTMRCNDGRRTSAPIRLGAAECHHSNTQSETPMTAYFRWLQRRRPARLQLGRHGPLRPRPLQHQSRSHVALWQQPRLLHRPPPEIMQGRPSHGTRAIRRYLCAFDRFF